MKILFKAISVLAAVSIIVSSCGGNNSKTQVNSITETSNENHKENKVVVEKSFTFTIPHSEIYTSSVQAYMVNNIVSQGMNRIEKLNFEVGDFVKKNQILARMDDVQLNQLQLKMNNDSLEFSRLKALYEEGGISKSDLDAIELGYNVSVSQYENMLKNTVLRSPISGVITKKNYEEGDMFGGGTPIYEVMQISPVKLLVGISESNYMDVHKGDNVKVIAEAIPNRTFDAKINKIYPTIDEATRTFIAEVYVPNKDYVLRPGMYAKVEVQFPSKESVVVSDMAITKLKGSGVKFVYVVKNGVVHIKEVEIGLHYDSKYEILSGLEDGEVVVVKGKDSLREGDKVTIVE